MTRSGATNYRFFWNLQFLNANYGNHTQFTWKFQNVCSSTYEEILIQIKSGGFKLSAESTLIRGGEWYLEKRVSRKILAGSRNVGSVFDKSRNLVFAWFVFTFFESRNFLPKSFGLGFLTRISASRRVSDFTIRHPSNWAITINIRTLSPPAPATSWGLAFSSSPWRFKKNSFTPEDVHQIWVYPWIIWVWLPLKIGLPRAVIKRQGARDFLQLLWTRLAPTFKGK